MSKVYISRVVQDKLLMDCAAADRQRMQGASLDEVINYVLLRFKCNSSLSGYFYIHKGIELIVLNPEYSKMIKKFLYYKISTYFTGENKLARAENPKPAAIARCIQYTIEVIWSMSTVDKEENYLMYLLFSNYVTRPNNAVFLCALADYVRLLIGTEK